LQQGIFTLGDISITTAQTYIGDWAVGFDGVTALSVDLQMFYGSGGTSGKIFLQTSLRQAFDETDAGVDLICMTFGIASTSRMFNLSGLTPQAAFIPTDGAMADDTMQDGMLGDRFRLKVVTLGTYAGQSVVSCRIAAR
jgi:hypothetical protein